MPERYDGVDSVVGLAATLRAAGVAATSDRVHAAVRAVSELGAGSRDDVYWATRLTLCGNADELPRFDQVFAAYFGDRPRVVVRRPRATRPVLQLVAAPVGGADDIADDDADDGAPAARAAASAAEQLRHRDIATLTGREREELRRLLALLRLPGQPRHSRRRIRAVRGPVDPPRTVRALLAAGGEPVRLRRQTRSVRSRRVVLLVDVSGSMDAYADALLRFAHAAARGGAPTEVFALGTRLTRLTRELSRRDPDAAMAAVADALPDAGGGTRLGVLVKLFLDRWGQRGTARGAVVVVLSDGWERDDAAGLGAQMARLRRLAHRVVWANPRKAAPGFAPVAAGMAAALPHVDDFVEGHSLAALEHLAAVVRGATRTQPAARSA